MVINFKLLSSTARLPVYSHDTDAGLDFFSDEECEMDVDSIYAFHTGVAWQPYFDAREEAFGLQNFFKIYMQIQGRSGLAINHGIDVMGGVIDSSYRGEIKIILKNNSDEPEFIERGMKIAQGIILLTPYTQIRIAKELDETVRGSGGFGSTGQG